MNLLPDGICRKDRRFGWEFAGLLLVDTGCNYLAGRVLGGYAVLHELQAFKLCNISGFSCQFFLFSAYLCTTQKQLLWLEGEVRYSF